DSHGARRHFASRSTPGVVGSFGAGRRGTRLRTGCVTGGQSTAPVTADRHLTLRRADAFAVVCDPDFGRDDRLPGPRSPSLASGSGADSAARINTHDPRSRYLKRSTRAMRAVR